ncbi:Hypothetical predicted protein [Cloeon dipterum]|uniref:PSI domain-containing protein n=2 Tax=Cloeon dipterum TaxID=197152 RepID=A0A8S1E1C6_9INSE|nr:Hypothetical predicted protein [Cloeon dipterum]
MTTDKFNGMQCAVFRDPAEAEGMWVDMDSQKSVKIRDMLRRKKLTVGLSFAFDLFGHKIREVKLSNSGEISHPTLDQVWVVTPLTITETTDRPGWIKYFDNGSTLTVQWSFEKDTIRHEKHTDWAKDLIFQATIHSSGRIDFIYKKIPLGNLQSFQAKFPFVEDSLGVKYYFKIPDNYRPSLFTLGFQIRVNETEITEDTVVIFEPLPLCTNFHTCSSCVNGRNETLLPCRWCSEIGSCSSKADFLQTFWHYRDCDLQEVSDPPLCPDYKTVPEHSDTKQEGSEEYSTQTWIINTLEIISVSIIFSIVFYILNSRFGFLAALRNRFEQNDAQVQLNLMEEIS